MSTKSLLTKAAVLVGSASIVVSLGAASASAATTSAKPLPKVPAIQLKDGRALEETGNGKVVVAKYIKGLPAEDFAVVKIPHSKYVYIQYQGPGRYHGYHVLTTASSRHAAGGSTLVKYQRNATKVTEQAQPRSKFEAFAVLNSHGRVVDLLTGENAARHAATAAVDLTPAGLRGQPQNNQLWTEVLGR